MAKTPSKQQMPGHLPPEQTQVTRKSVLPLGGYVLASGSITINDNRPRTKLKVRNTGDRPIQVGSHFHFFETNRYLEFDRPAAFGLRLDIPANTAIRFEAGDEKEVTLVPFAGKQFAYGFNNLVDGWTGDGPNPDYRPNKDEAVRKAHELGFKFEGEKGSDKSEKSDKPDKTRK